MNFKHLQYHNSIQIQIFEKIFSKIPGDEIR